MLLMYITLMLATEYHCLFYLKYSRGHSKNKEASIFTRKFIFYFWIHIWKTVKRYVTDVTIW